MDTAVYPDVEGAIKTWLKSVSAVNTHFAGVIGLKIKATDDAHLEISLLNAPEDVSTAPVVPALVQLDVWGAKNDRVSATTGMRLVLAALRTLKRGSQATPTGGTAVVFTATPVVAGIRYLPDPADDRPRYAMTVRFMAHSAS